MCAFWEFLNTNNNADNSCLLYYWCAASTATRPITDAAQEKNKIINVTK
jgi:hypothetical protein